MDSNIQEMLRRAENLREGYRGKENRFTMGIPDHGSLLKVLLEHCREKGLLTPEMRSGTYSQEVLSILAERAAFILEVIYEFQKVGSVLNWPDSEKYRLVESLEKVALPGKKPQSIRKYFDETCVRLGDVPNWQRN